MKKRSFLLAAALCAGAVYSQAAAAKDVVKIAFVGPITGGNSAVGLGGRNSAQLAVNLRNADPKAKYTYELETLDDECKPNVGVQVATKIASDKNIIAGVTHYCSTVAIITVDTYHKFGLPVIVWGAILPEITYGQDFKEIHRVNGTMVNEAKLTAQKLLGLGFKKYAIIHDTTDYGKGQNKYFREFLQQGGGQILGTYGVGADQQDFAAELTAIQALKPDLVYFGGTTPLAVRIRTQMDRMGVNAQFMGVSGIMTAGYMQGAGKELAEGTLSFSNGAPIDKYPKGKQFLADYAKAGFQADPDAYGPFAYSAATMIMDAIEQVGPNRAKVRDVLNKTKDYDALVGKVTLDERRQNVVSPYTYVVQDGKWTYWDDSEYASGKRKLKLQK